MSESRVADHVGRVLGGRYRLIAPIGVGTSGEVYLADDTRLRRQVAVKVLHKALAADETFLRRFRAEAQVAASLNHPNIVAVHDWGEDEVPYIVTEYLSGGSLRAMLDEQGSLSPSQTLLVGLEAARGLDYAHKRGVVQRDVKPANVLFDAEGHVRIADFGLAKALAEASVTEPSGTVVGTVRYASPEQALGRPADARSDVYALGLVLIEAIRGSLPFDADSPVATLMARVDTPVELDDSFGALRDPLERACSVAPGDRPDAGELHRELLAAAERLPRPEPLPTAGAMGFDPILHELRDPTTHVGDVGDAGQPRRLDAETRAGLGGDEPGEERRRRWPFAIVALVLLAGVGAGTWYALNSSEVATDVVPEAIGSTPDQFRARVGDFWDLTEALDREDGSTVGTILRLDPPPGTELDEGEAITYWVSQGNEMRTVPDTLVGATLAEAEAMLADAGLVLGEAPTSHDEQAPAGTVLSVATVDEMLPTGEAVDLVVSAGPSPRPVPDGLIGLPYAQARSRLAVDGLETARTRVYDDIAPEGTVVSVDPAVGTELARGDTVTLTVSRGPAPVEVPSLVGRGVADAAAALRAIGFCIGDTDGPPDTSVIGTDPPAGTVQPYGSCIRIVTSEFG